jgi:hypothetical protein
MPITSASARRTRRRHGGNVEPLDEFVVDVAERNARAIARRRKIATAQLFVNR